MTRRDWFQGLAWHGADSPTPLPPNPQGEPPMLLAGVRPNGLNCGLFDEFDPFENASGDAEILGSSQRLEPVMQFTNFHFSQVRVDFVDCYW